MGVRPKRGNLFSVHGEYIAFIGAPARRLGCPGDRTNVDGRWVAEQVSSESSGGTCLSRISKADATGFDPEAVDCNR